MKSAALVAARATLAALATLTTLGACGTKGDTPAAPIARTDSAKVATGQGPSTDAFCDLHAAGNAAHTFQWPELEQAAPGATKTWRWVNVWATWCEPCIKELPLIAAWRDKLAAAGTPVEMTLISLDDSDDDIAAFRKEHPTTPPSLRMTAADHGSKWLASLGLGDGAIPIHMFVSQSGQLRCARAGSVRESDYAVVQKLLGE